MYIKVVFMESSRGDCGASDVQTPTEILVNPDSPIRVIYDFIRKAFNVGDNYELDLCDENGTLIFMYEKEQWVCGLNYLLPKATYFVVLFEKDDENRVTNPLLYLPDSSKKSSAQWNELMGKIRKQINPGFSKPSRMSKTRSNSSHAK